MSLFSRRAHAIVVTGAFPHRSRRLTGHIFTLTGGLLLVAAGMMLDGRILEHIRHAPFHNYTTVVEIVALQASLRIVGVAIVIYAVLSARVNSGTLALGRPDSQPVVALLSVTIILAALSAPFLIYDVQRMFYSAPFNWDEGWNVFHTADLMQGKPLYRPIGGFPLTPLKGSR